MKKIVLSILLMLCFKGLKTQTCEEMMDFVKSESYGSTFYSYDSDAISKVTFYSVYMDYKTYYFAIVCFKRKYAYQCSEYIYQVASNTKMYYSMNYMESAGKAFWEYIQPYNKNLGCAPDF
ncbi:hypothetical protein [Flagellimonas sp.]|uniref:hypothetical protein n=1 Tax=Flagellimonas sp. TaxID=2058762 RepID=UPI003C7D2CF2